MSDLPPKVTMDATTDQVIAGLRDKRAALDGDASFGAGLSVELTTGVADQFREQFGPACGRVLVAVAETLQALDGATRAFGMPLSAASLAGVIGLAGEQLDREATS